MKNDDTEAVGGNRRLDQQEDYGENSGGVENGEATSSSSTCCCSEEHRRDDPEWECTFRFRSGAVSSHYQSPAAGGRRPLLLPSVRWPMVVTTKRKRLRRSIGTKSIDPSLITPFALLALICLSSVLNTFSGLKPIGWRQAPNHLQNIVGGSAPAKEGGTFVDEIIDDVGTTQSRPHIAATVEAVVAQRLRKLHHSLADLNPSAAVSLAFSSSPRRVNVLLTEQQRPPSRPDTPSSLVGPMALMPAAEVTPVASPPASFVNLQQQADDPTLMDYDAIDAYWRIDIEQEKSGGVAATHHYEQQLHNNVQQQQPAALVEPMVEWHRQYERDLQLLTEKSMFSLQQQFMDEQPPPAPSAGDEALPPFLTTKSTEVEDEHDRCHRYLASTKVLSPTSSANDNNNERVESGEWLNNILLEDDDTDVTASGWAERWWKTVEDFAAVSVVPQNDVDKLQTGGVNPSNQQEQDDEEMAFYLDGIPQSPSSSLESLMKNSAENYSTDTNLLGLHRPSSLFDLASSPFGYPFEDDFLENGEEESVGPTISATEAILRDMTATIPLIQNLDFSTNSQADNDELDQWNTQQNDVTENDTPSSSDYCKASLSAMINTTSGLTDQHRHPQQCSSSVRCSSTTSSGFGSFIGAFDDVPPSPSTSNSSSCTLLEFDENKYEGVDGCVAAVSSTTNDETAATLAVHSSTLDAASSSHSYRMEKLVPLLSSATPTTSSKRRRQNKMVASTVNDVSQQKQKRWKKRMATINKKEQKAQQQQQDEEEELRAISFITTESTIQQQHQQQQQLGSLKLRSKRGRKSKDNSLVNEHELPYSAEWLTGMPYIAYSELMNDIRLSAQQKALIKKIRRRGRNKIAAQKCRERRVNYRQVEWEEDQEEWPMTENYEDDKQQEEEECLVESEQDEHFGEGAMVMGRTNGGGGVLQRRDQLLDPSTLSLYPTTSTAPTAAATVVAPHHHHTGAEDVDDHRRRQAYTDFVHSAIAQRRAVRVHV